jgi:hypothetical protein
MVFRHELYKVGTLDLTTRLFWVSRFGCPESSSFGSGQTRGSNFVYQD